MRPKRLETLQSLGVSVDHRRSGARAVAIGVLAVLAGCAGVAPEVAEPRPIVIHSGARLRVEHERMKEVKELVTSQHANIVDDPTFMIYTDPSVDEVYIWDQLEIEGDTVHTPVHARAADSRLVHELYAHFHLMVDMGVRTSGFPKRPMRSSTSSSARSSCVRPTRGCSGAPCSTWRRTGRSTS